nr:uncharacterized protein LOC128672212 [Plodia interpunctella]
MDTKRKKGDTYCSVPGCKNLGATGLSFHHFPKNKDVRKLWETVLEMKKPASNFMRICAEHFFDSDYSSKLIKPKLKRYAVPSRKLPGKPKTFLSTYSVTLSTHRDSINTHSDSINTPCENMTVARPIRVYSRSQKKKAIPVLVKSDESMCHTKQGNSSASVTIMKDIKIEFDINNVSVLPVEFEASTKLDKECLVDESYPEQENIFICNRLFADERTCNVEVQTCVERNSNVKVKEEPIFENEEMDSKIKLVHENQHYCKEEPPEFLFDCKKEPELPCKREPSPELIPQQDLFNP